MELQLHIWEEALALWTVWTGRTNRTALASDGQSPAVTMTFVGPEPYLAGLSCRYSRRVLELTYVKPIHLATNASAYWVNLETTIIHLGEPSDAGAVLDAFSSNDLAKFRHIDMPWHPGRFGDIARTCRTLATKRIPLRTIIIQRCDLDPASNQNCCQDLGQERAASYMALPDYSGPLLVDDTIDTSHFRSLLLEYFGNAPPRLHLLPLEAATCTVASASPGL